MMSGNLTRWSWERLVLMAVAVIGIATWSVLQYRAGSVSHQRGDAAAAFVFQPADQAFVIKDAQGAQRPATMAEVLSVVVAERVAQWKQQEAEKAQQALPAGK